MLHQLQLMGLNLRYADPAASSADDWQAASALISHAAPELRLAAVQLLSALAKAAAPAEVNTAVSSEKHATANGVGGSLADDAGPAAAPVPMLSAVQQARVDAAFLSLCSAVSTDTVAAIRLEALLGLAGEHYQEPCLLCSQQLSSLQCQLAVTGSAVLCWQGAGRIANVPMTLDQEHSVVIICLSSFAAGHATRPQQHYPLLLLLLSLQLLQTCSMPAGQ
jgi:hypothetical protein